MKDAADTYGLLAEFAEADDLVTAADRVHEAGYRQVEAYSPLPIEGLAEALGFRRTGLPLVVFCGGVIGCLAGYALQYYTMAISYPINVGGRPLNSWPAFVPVMFEMTVLFAAFSAVLGMLGMNGLPRPHHPLFAISKFDRASQDGFFLLVRQTDPLFDEKATRELLQQLGSMEISDVPR